MNIDNLKVSSDNCNQTCHFILNIRYLYYLQTGKYKLYNV